MPGQTTNKTSLKITSKLHPRHCYKIGFIKLDCPFISEKELCLWHFYVLFYRKREV